VSKPHVFIATPAFSGKVNVQYAISLADTKVLLESNGIQVSTRICASGSLLVAERNRLLEAFWQSDATHILCIDSDLGWPQLAVMAMLDADKEIIAGLYPARGKTREFIFRPETNPNGSLVTDKHLIKMEYIPAGFMLIKREAIAKMRDALPELYYAPKDPRSEKESTYCLFNTEVWNGEFWGEDYIFCRNATKSGIDIWVDPFIQFDHDGTIGMFHEVLTQENPNEIDQGNTIDVEASEATLSTAA
jgi:hypothetical protein